MIRADTSVQQLQANTVPLGIAADLSVDKPSCMKLDPGDAFIVLSDVFFERTNPNDRMFTVDHVISTLQQSINQNAQQILQHLHHAVDTFAQGKHPEDDQTAVIIKRQP